MWANIVVAFRGSQDLNNWITNLNIPKTKPYLKCTGCAVHEGFLGAWNSVKHGVVAEVKRLLAEEPKAKIFITGHSLGAALAALCAVELGASSHSLGFPIEGVYTFGEPRVGNKAFADFYNTGNKVSWRLTHWRDPVPHLPSSGLGFQHISTEVFYTENSKKFTVCDSSGEDQKCSDKLLFDGSINDHLTYMGESAFTIDGQCH
jgi:predicted lipase